MSEPTWLDAVNKGLDAMNDVGLGLLRLRGTFGDVGLLPMASRMEDFYVKLADARTAIANSVSAKVTDDVKAAEAGSRAVVRAAMAGAEARNERNRHTDCAAADRVYAHKGEAAVHCHAEHCEDCHGR